MIDKVKGLFNGQLKSAGYVVAFTGLLTTMLTFFINRQELGITEFDRTSKILQDQIDILREENTLLKLRIDREVEERQKIQNQFNLLISSQFNRPFPEWIKLDGKVIFLNKKYEEVFLLPRGKTMDDYIMRKDISVWEKEQADEYTRNDNKVITSGRPWSGTVKVPMGDGQKQEWKVYKYPYYFGMGSQQKVGVAGIAIPMEAID
jgi:hypothetical protein